MRAREAGGGGGCGERGPEGMCVCGGDGGREGRREGWREGGREENCNRLYFVVTKRERYIVLVRR